MPYDCDLIVVGSGAGGATMAYACAQAGKSVLLLERGGNGQALEDPVQNERAMLIEKRPYDDREVEVNGAVKHLYMGGVLGGGTALYGAALMRPSVDDFHPGKHYGGRIPREIWDWPISYESMEPYYARSEKLYGVAGSQDEDYGPLEKPKCSYAHQPLPLHPINARLMKANRAGGLRPFRLPLAINPDMCLRCSACAGYVCPTGARASSAHLLNCAKDDGLALRVESGVEVEQLLFEAPPAGSHGERVSGVSAVHRKTGEGKTYRARGYALAAGAIGSTLILLRSGRNGSHVGRNYMTHLSPVVAGIFPGATGADESFVKQVGFADYYFGDNAYSHKMGIIQSLPVPGPLMTAKMASPLVPKAVLAFMRRRMLPLAGIVEDLPNPTNHVSFAANGKPQLRHRFGKYDLERGKALTKRMEQILKRAGARLCISKSFASDEHVAHQCGTLRFGKDPRHAVLDSDCRMFDVPNLFVADGSFFPTSLGVGPALTIIANALHVADVIIKEL